MNSPHYLMDYGVCGQTYLLLSDMNDWGDVCKQRPHIGAKGIYILLDV